MTSKRDLGPPLAIAGGAVVITAVIAGFIVIGGPGDARDRRLDGMTTQHIINIASAAQCAVSFGDGAPADLAGVRQAVERARKQPAESPVCDTYGITPITEDVEYSKLAEDRIRLCGNFLRPFDPDDAHSTRYPDLRDGRFTELAAPRLAGRHCYEIELVKPLSASPT